MPQPVHDLSDLQDRPILGQFYNYELHRFIVSTQIEFQIARVVRTRHKNGIKHHLVRWREYNEIFNSRVNASDIKEL